MANTELQFEMAMRDQVIHNQREALRNMWNLLMGLGLDERQILDLAAKQGIMIEDWTVTPYLGLSDKKQSPNPASGRLEPLGYCPYTGQSFLTTSCIFQHCQDFGSRSFSREHWDSASTFCREEHHSSYYLMSHDHSPSSHVRLRRSSEHWVGGRPSPFFGILMKHPQNLRHSYPEIRTHSSPYGESHMSSSSHSADFGNQHKVRKPNIIIVDMLLGACHVAIR
jgi:kinesin family protein 18/19